MFIKLSSNKFLLNNFELNIKYLNLIFSFKNEVKKKKFKLNVGLLFRAIFWAKAEH